MDTTLTLDPVAKEIEAVKELLEKAGLQAVPAETPDVVEFVAAPRLPGRVTLAESRESLVVDFYLRNAVWLTGPARATAMETLLQLNEVALQGRQFGLGLDNRDYILLTASLGLKAEADAVEALSYLAGQARRIQELIGEVALQDVEVNVQLVLPAA